MTVIYIDEIFLRNAMIDLFLISITARLAGLTRWRKSYLIAAFTGGLYAALSYLPDWFFLTSVPVQCAAGVGLALIAFGYEKYLIRLTILFFAVSSGFAGFALALRLFAAQTFALDYMPNISQNISNIPDFSNISNISNHIIFYPISENIFKFFYFITRIISNPNMLTVCAAICVYIALELGFYTAARLHASGKIARIKIRVLDRVTECAALLDSGNNLRDGGQPVLIISPDIFNSILPPETRKILSPEKLRLPPDLIEPIMKIRPELKPRLISYHAVGISDGLLLTIGGDWIESGGTRYARPRVALSPTPLGDGYQAIWKL